MLFSQEKCHRLHTMTCKPHTHTQTHSHTHTLTHSSYRKKASHTKTLNYNRFLSNTLIVVQVLLVPALDKLPFLSGEPLNHAAAQSSVVVLGRRTHTGQPVVKQSCFRSLGFLLLPRWEWFVECVQGLGVDPTASQHDYPLSLSLSYQRGRQNHPHEHPLNPSTPPRRLGEGEFPLHHPPTLPTAFIPPVWSLVREEEGEQ